MAQQEPWCAACLPICRAEGLPSCASSRKPTDGLDERCVSAGDRVHRATTVRAPFSHEAEPAAMTREHQPAPHRVVRHYASALQPVLRECAPRVPVFATPERTHEPRSQHAPQLEPRAINASSSRTSRNPRLLIARRLGRAPRESMWFGCAGEHNMLCALCFAQPQNQPFVLAAPACVAPSSRPLMLCAQSFLRERRSCIQVTARHHNAGGPCWGPQQRSAERGRKCAPQNGGQNVTPCQEPPPKLGRPQTRKPSTASTPSSWKASIT